jgi:hypothetical protein
VLRGRGIAGCAGADASGEGLVFRRWAAAFSANVRANDALYIRVVLGWSERVLPATQDLVEAFPMSSQARALLLFLALQAAAGVNTQWPRRCRWPSPELNE